MANKKISQLDSRASLSLSDLLAVGDPTTGYLYKITITDLKTLTGAGVVSFNGRVGSVTPAEGDYSLNQLGDVIITTATNNDVLRYNGSNWVNAQLFTGTIAQYVDGTGAYQTFPTLLSSDRLITEVRNTTGATVTKGTVIYLNGSSGTLPLIAKAQANGESTSTGTYGVVQNDIANNSNGYVVVIGNLTGIDTSAYSAGSILWLSPTVAGGYTTTKPSAPNHAVYIGIVTRSNSTQGTIEVKIANGYEIEELHNVSISSVANNEVLVYESASSLWKNKTIPTILGYTPANAANYVPYTGATGDVNLGSYNLTLTNIYSSYAFSLTNELGNAYFGGMLRIYRNPSFTTNVAYTNIFSKNGTSLSLYLGNGTAYKQADIDLTGLTNNTLRTYSFPDASGTIALTSDIPSLSDYVTLSTTQTITADKTFTGGNIFNGINTFNTYQPRFTVGIALNNTLSGGAVSSHTVIGANTNGLKINLAGGSYNNLNFANTASGHTYLFPNADGTIALTSDPANLAVATPITYNGNVLRINLADSTTSGYISSTDWNTFNNKVPASRTITINGTAYDLSADRAWTISGSSQWTTSGSNIYYNSGSVGVGTTSPSNFSEVAFTGPFLDVAGIMQIKGTSANTIAALQFGGNTYRKALIYSSVGTDTPYLAFGVSTSGSSSSANETMRVNSSGALLIGKTTQDAGSLLEVAHVGTAATIVCNSTDTNNPYIYLRQSGGSAFGAIQSNTALVLKANNTEYVRITTSGLVGIGTSSPERALDIRGGSAVASHRLQLYNNYSSVYMQLYTGGDGQTGLFSNSFLTFNAGSGLSEAMRINTNGSVCIGGTYSSANFSVAGVSASLGLIDSSATGNGDKTVMIIASKPGVGYNNLNYNAYAHTWYIGGGQSLSMQIISSGLVYMPYVYSNTSGGAASIGISALGELFRSTSSLKYKKNVRDYDKGLDIVKQLRPVYYESINQNEDGVQYAGLIAEEIHNLGLTEFVQYAVDGTPDALAYQNMVALAFKAIQELKSEIDILKNK